MPLQRLFENDHPLVGLAGVAERPGLKPKQTKVVGMVGGCGSREIHGGAVPLRGDVGLHQIAGDRRVFRRQVARLLERGN